ncbi:hypothetical protein [Simkania sp.]|uniref:hypothetical protein n=1 Tax=Simkania sp. TaxID=34094 RepID=UPI003B521C52
MYKLLALCFLVVFGFLLPEKACAAVNQVTMEIDGLYCPFCSAPTERRVKRAMGASDAKMYLERGVIVFTMQPQSPFKPEAAIKKLGDSSFKYVGMTVNATGKLSSVGGTSTLEVPENDIAFKIEDSDEITLKAKKVLEASSGREVTVEGQYYANPDDPQMPILKVFKAS